MSKQRPLITYLAITLCTFLPAASQRVAEKTEPEGRRAKSASEQAPTPQASESSSGAGESSQLGYDRAVQQGRAQLVAGNADSAFTSGESAIKIDASRWEAYALTGGALM